LVRLEQDGAKQNKGRNHGCQRHFALDQDLEAGSILFSEEILIEALPVVELGSRKRQAVRASIQRSKASIQELSEHYDLNPKTVMKWKKRDFVHDAPMGPKSPRSTVLSAEEEALIVTFRRHTLLPLDDCLYALQATIPHLTRSSLHRLFQRHDISRLPASKERGRERDSRPTQLAISTLILQKCAPNRAGSICSWPSTASASSPLPSFTRRRHGALQPSSYAV
jgi:transposase-like protein